MTGLFFNPCPMLRLLTSKADRRKDLRKPSKPCHIGIQWRTLTEYSQMSISMCQGFSHFSGF